MRTTHLCTSWHLRVTGKHLSTESGTCDPYDLDPHMLESPASWWMIVEFVEMVIGVKKETGRTRNSNVGIASPG